MTSACEATTRALPGAAVIELSGEVDGSAATVLTEAYERAVEASPENHDTVVLDFGGLRDGYGSDTTRTVHVGQPTDEVRRVYELVQAAQQAAFEAVRPGVECQEIDTRAGGRDGVEVRLQTLPAPAVLGAPLAASTLD